MEYEKYRVGGEDNCGPAEAGCYGQSPDGRRQVMVDTAQDRLYGRIIYGRIIWEDHMGGLEN